MIIMDIGTDISPIIEMVELMNTGILHGTINKTIAAIDAVETVLPKSSESLKCGFFEMRCAPYV
jgi:hypothetical protein